MKSICDWLGVIHFYYCVWQPALSFHPSEMFTITKNRNFFSLMDHYCFFFMWKLIQSSTASANSSDDLFLVDFCYLALFSGFFKCVEKKLMGWGRNLIKIGKKKPNVFHKIDIFTGSDSKIRVHRSDFWLAEIKHLANECYYYWCVLLTLRIESLIHIFFTIFKRYILSLIIVIQYIQKHRVI